MLKELLRIATKLDSIGLTKEADLLDKLMAKASHDPELDFEYEEGIDPDSDLHDIGEVGMSGEDIERELAEASEEEMAEHTEQMNNPDYVYYILRALDKDKNEVSGLGGFEWQICSGWEYLEDAKDAFKDAAMDKSKDKIVHKSRLGRYEVNEENNDDWS